METQGVYKMETQGVKNGNIDLKWAKVKVIYVFLEFSFYVVRIVANDLFALYPEISGVYDMLEFIFPILQQHFCYFCI